MTEPGGSSVVFGDGAHITGSVVAGRDVVYGREDPTRTPNDPCPYPGLSPFRESDRAFLFGRDDEIAELVRRVGTTPFTAVVGASGVGKSSLIRAGLLPELRESGSVIIELDPRADVPAGLATGGEHRVVWIDQAEQIFLPGVPTAEVTAAIVEAVASQRFVHIIVSFRSDVSAAFDVAPDLQRLIDTNLVRVQPLDRADWREIIEGPARAASLTLENGLVEEIQLDIPPTPGALPLLAVALRSTWEARYRGRLEIAGYRASGGVEKALERLAERAYGDLDDSDRQLAEWAFSMRLTTQGIGLEPTRRRATMAELSSSSFASAARFVDTFRGYRLFTVTHAKDDPDTTVEIVHEALLRSWPRLSVDWLQGSGAEARRLQGWISQATAEWVVSGRSPEALRSGTQVESAHDAVTRRTLQLTEDETAFVAQSMDRHRSTAERSRRLQQIRRGLAALLVVTLALGAVALVAVRQSSRERSLRKVAQTLRLAAAGRATSSQNRDLSLLLTLEGVRRSSTTDSWSALVDALGAPGPSTYLRAGLQGPVAAIAPATGGGRRTVFVADGSPTVKVLDAVTGAPASSPISTGVAVNELAVVDAASGRLISGSRGGELVIADIAGPGWVPFAAAGAARLQAIAVVGSWLLATATDGTLLQWSLATPTASPTSSRPFGAVPISALAAVDDDTVALGSDTGDLAFWTPSTSALTAGPLSISPNPVVALATISGQRRIAAVGTGSVTIWDGRSEPVIVPILLTSVAWRNAEVLVGGLRSGDVVEIAVPSGAVVGSPRRAHHALVRSIQATAEGSVLTLDEDGVAIAWPPPNQSPLASVIPSDIGASGGRQRRITTPSGPVRLDPRRGLISASNVVLLAVPTGTNGTDLAASAEGTVALGLDNGDVLVKRSGSQVLLHDAGGQIRALAISPDGRLVATAALDPGHPGRASPIKLFDLASGRSSDLAGHHLFVDALQFSPDGRLLASGSDDRTVKIWNVTSGQETFTLRGHTDLISAIAWLDNDVIATGGQDADLRLWSARRGAALSGALISGSADQITDLTLTNGQLVAIQGDTTVSWTVGGTAWIMRACQAVARGFTASEWADQFGGTPVDPCAKLTARPLDPSVAQIR